MLDMGEPVRIVELARAMIELSGLDPDRDIEIEEVGRRPGEKLHEELFNSYERRLPTSAEKILLAAREPLAPEVVEEMFAEINLLVLEGDAAGLAAKVAGLTSAARRRVEEKPVRPEAARPESVHPEAVRPEAARPGSADPEPATASASPVPLIHSADA